ncbi:hypothetical protein CDAR_40621 [Caerostris darwini]|uniref:Uncharacterized protein n=1 Tax=Caerostris darwini TaxID=1538125 RepID=A0AAV4RDD9_9ARAC|nr:hypothetical protein CDAR_40621 [Caerostris darwini]
MKIDFLQCAITATQRFVAHRVHAPRQYSTVQAGAFGVPRLLSEIKTMEKEEKTHSKCNKFRKRCYEREAQG